MPQQTLPLRSVVVAIVVGSFAGAAAGLWSIRSRPAETVASDQIPIVEAVVAPPAAPPPAPSPRIPAPSVQPLSRAAGATPVEGVSALARARDMAARGDVRGLLAVREELVRRADERGVEELDRYLTEARALRLKLDSEELRKSGGLAAGR